MPTREKRRDPRRGQNHRGKFDELKCNHCGKHGHLKAKCWLHNGRLESTNAVEVWDDPIKMQHFVALLAQQAGKKEKQTDKEWILDTRATVHMTHHHNFFVKFQPQGGHVTACKGGMTQIEGIGDIMVQGSLGTVFCQA